MFAASPTLSNCGSKPSDDFDGKIRPMASPDRVIAHIDMDAFFASVEQLDNPGLRDKPILVGHDGPRSVVTTASYEARPFGCRSAMPMAVARRLCPQAIVVPMRGWRYRELSKQMLAILCDFSPLVEPVSIDEAYVDLTASQRLLGDGPTIGAAIRQRIKNELQLTASVGIAPNKFLAKLASDLKKPDSLMVINTSDIDTVLCPLPISRIWGIGPRTTAKLEAINLRSIADLRRMPLDWFVGHFGIDGQRLHNLTLGIDDRPVTPDEQARSISHEHTFSQNAIEAQIMRSLLLEQVENVTWRLRRSGLKAQSVRLKLRFDDFKTISRSTALETATDSTDTIWKAALNLFDTWARQSFQPVRLIGITAASLVSGGGQLGLFDQQTNQRQSRIDHVVDKINGRFGKSSIHRARIEPDS